MDSRRRFDALGFVTLLIANGFTIWLFATGGGSILEVLWIYWLQSVVIGAVNIPRLYLANMDKFDIRVNGKLLQMDTPEQLKKVKVILPIFFLIHYGTFHLVYAVFLWVFAQPGVTMALGETVTNGIMLNSPISWFWVGVSGLAFAVHHWLAFAAERKYILDHPDQAPPASKVMFRPYMRIIPMHLIIIAGPVIAMLFGNVAVFAAFMVLKTLFDVIVFFKFTDKPAVIGAQ
jgi:hypothetical protein